ncbi:MAG: hypothetical protein K8S99_00120 [Planctomycetes bacterium]|nr:hypothetical protein [Planctomycetota bacterium]
MAGKVYHEAFDDGPGGWCGFASNALGPRSLDVRDGCAISRSPWWIDYNHAPPGAGYLHLLFISNTRGVYGEHQREVAGRCRFADGKFPTNFTNASVTIRARGELETRGAQMVLLFQATFEGICSGWMLTGRPFKIAKEWTEQTVTLDPDPKLWTCLDSRHDRTDSYGRHELGRVLADVNLNMMFILFPLTIAPMGDIGGDPHRLRPERDYPIWRSRLPEGYVMLDDLKIEWPG